MNLVKEKKPKNKQLVKRHELKNSPFVVIETNKQFFLTMGKYRLSEKLFNNIEEVNEWMEINKWELLTNFCSIIASETVNLINNQKQN